MAEHNDVGRWGEQIAVDYLVVSGHAIMARNWRSGHYELDIVAMKGSRVIFVEVKTRSNTSDDPVEAIDRRKVTRLIRAAEAFADVFNVNHEMQFDIIAITGTPDDYHIEHIPDAFESPLITYR